MRQAIKGKDSWTGLESLLTGTNAFVLIKGDVGSAVKAVQAFQKETQKSETKGGLFEGKLYLKMKSKRLQNFQVRKYLWHKLLVQ